MRVLLADEHELKGVGLGILLHLQEDLARDLAPRVDGGLVELDAEGARAAGVAHFATTGIIWLLQPAVTRGQIIPVDMSRQQGAAVESSAYRDVRLGCDSGAPFRDLHGGARPRWFPWQIS